MIWIGIDGIIGIKSSSGLMNGSDNIFIVITIIAILKFSHQIYIPHGARASPRRTANPTEHYLNLFCLGEGR